MEQKRLMREERARRAREKVKRVDPWILEVDATNLEIGRGGSRISRRERGPVRGAWTSDVGAFGKNVSENERIGSCRGECAWHALPPRSANGRCQRQPSANHICVPKRLIDT